jgi:thiamine-monophosphate kinase
MGGARASGQFRKQAVDSVLEPRPRQDFAILAPLFSSSIDSSDGLATSLYEIAMQSRVDIHIDYEKVKAAGVDEFAQANGLDPRSLVFFGGEEYEIVATIPKKSLAKARALAKKAGVALHEVGTVKKGIGKVYAGKLLLENRGYQHLG